jgi:purine-nucleoside phosphorylase
MNELRPDFAGPSLLDRARAPLLERDDHFAPSVFRPENMLRESRRQKGLRSGAVPAVCLLDPDGDIVDHVRKQFGATRSPHWACYHTRLWEWDRDGVRYGIVGYAVGGAFSVLVAEQLFASGCRLLVNVASAGQISDVGAPPYYILVDRALRDEGTSYHYLPPAAFADADPALIALAQAAFARSGCRVHTGSTWTTDAPFRETAESIALRRAEGVLAVEMEAAALYAFASACGRPVVCLAHVSNRLGCVEGDFEKGDGNGVCGSVELVTRLALAWLQAARAGMPGSEVAAAE